MSIGVGFDAVPLRDSVLCAACEVITASPFDTCQICGSRSLLCLSRVLGGRLEGDRAVLARSEAPVAVEPTSQLRLVA